MPTYTGDNECVELDISDGVGELRLADPEKRNAFSLGLAADLFELTKGHLVENDALRAVAITAEGPVFSAGADVNLVQGNDPEEMDRVHDYRRPVFDWIRNGPVPTIAGAQGAVVGLGGSFFAAADMRVAGRDVAYWLPEVEYDIAPAELAVYLAERVGTGNALELVLMGKPGTADADRLVDMGLVNRVVDPDDVRDATLDMARTIADNTAGNDVGTEMLEAMKDVRREAISASLAGAVETQEGARHGAQVMTQGRSLYED